MPLTTSTHTGIIEHYEDDGEWGAGRMLLKLLRENNVTNSLVCVTRWYGGKHLGRTRFDLIKEAACQVLSIHATHRNSNHQETAL